MSKIHKHGIPYNIVARNNLYQYLLQRHISQNEDIHHRSIDYHTLFNLIYNCEERKTLIENKNKKKENLPVKKIPYTVIKINDRAQQSLIELHTTLKNNFEYKSNINFINYKKDNVFDFYNQRDIKINWMGKLFGLSSNYLMSELGAFASHIKCLEYIVENNIPEMIVFEDDVILSDNFMKNFKHVYADLPKDYDFISDSTFVPNYEELCTNTENILTDSLFLNKAYLQNAYVCFMMYSLAGAKKILNLVKQYGIICPVDTLFFFLNREHKLNGYSTYHDNRFILSTDFIGSFRNADADTVVANDTSEQQEINVVMMVYNRPEYFDEVLYNLSKQTVKFKLHIVSNSPDNNLFFKSVIEKYKLLGMEIFFCEADNSRMTAERWFYVKDHLLHTDFVLFVDDDVIVHEDTIEQVWNSKEHNTMKVYQGRKFLVEQDTITEDVFNSSARSDHPEMSYGALNLGIVDTVYWKEPLLFDLEHEYPTVCYKADDLMLSWAINKLGGQIKNHNITPKVNLGDTDSKALYKQIQSTIYEKYDFFDKIHKFKRF
jgi:GR25 family glycosyltransferase involved in LPS biosynthesis